MSEKDETYWRRKMLKLARTVLKRADDIPSLCIDDFLDGMADAPRSEEENQNCRKARNLLTFLIDGLDERIEDIRTERENSLFQKTP